MLLAGPVASIVTGRWSELFSRFYRRRTLTVWTLWFVAYLINNGTLTWMPSLYRTLFQLPLQSSLIYGFRRGTFHSLVDLQAAI